MADSLLVALAGGTIGALITAVIGYAANVKVVRRQAENARELQRRQTAHELDLERMRIQHALTTQQAAENHQRELERARATAERHQRFLRFRGVGKAWLRELHLVVQQLDEGEQVAPDAFDAQFSALAREADEASDALLSDSIWVASADDLSAATPPLFGALAEATRQVRAAVGNNVAGQTHGVPQPARDAVHSAAAARDQFRLTLLDLLAAEGNQLRRI
ncbi:hypothetical protein ACIO3O_13960 [Streptomyces sp. NPDC087440]|uniref:hypothetical protein n=1 Tax=Streptomyces sp. NPDC087440 TaxID=3365790 RepID=UPI003824CDDF